MTVTNAPRIGVTGLHTYGRQSPKFRQYCGHVRHAGGFPLPLGTHHHRLPDHLSGLLLAGGEDVDPAGYGESAHPTHRGNVRRDVSERHLIEAALARRLPILAICRGSQLLNVMLGGSLIQDLPSQTTGSLAHAGGVRHDIDVLGGTRLACLVGAGTTEVNSYHHQAVARLAPGLIVNARATDGTIEGWEPAPGSDLEGRVMAVQWHPERAPWLDPVSGPIFAAFIESARAVARR